MKRLLLVSSAALLVAAVLGIADPGALAGQEAGAATVTSIFKVEGMTCGGCEAAVRKVVKKLDGVAEVTASYKESRAEVTYDPEKVTPDQIEAVIEDLGYTAELQEEDGGASEATAAPSDR